MFALKFRTRSFRGYVNSIDEDSTTVKIVMFYYQLFAKFPFTFDNTRLFAGACYKKAKQALHTALPERLVCRDKELGEVTDFVHGHLQAKTAGSLYLSGAPGTGKTAVISHARQWLEVRVVTAYTQS